MNLQENISRIKKVMGLNEGLHDTSWQNEEGDKITLMDLLNATEDIPVERVSVEELKPHLLTWDGDEDEVKKIESAGVKAGIAVGISEKLESIYPYLEYVKHVLLLAIPKPGFSGQKFDMEILPWIDELNQHANRQNFEICLDGGVNQTTVKYLNVESVVSGSFILSAPNPIKNIMLLQTSGEYEKY